MLIKILTLFFILTIHCDLRYILLRQHRSSGVEDIMKHLFIIISLVSLLLFSGCTSRGEIVYAAGSDSGGLLSAPMEKKAASDRNTGDEAIKGQNGPLERGKTEKTPKTEEEEKTNAAGLHNEIYISVLGEVNEPGIYVFDGPVRLFEVINAAGGSGPDADLTRIDLVNIIQEDCSLIIPKIEGSSEPEEADIFVRDVPVMEASGTVTSGASSKGSDSLSPSLVNINKADKEELMTLKGIGATRADAIIAYRNEHGRFTRPEDLMNVAGIKEGTFGKLKDSITVD